jgi:uracil-DNA glycosylase
MEKVTPTIEASWKEALTSEFEKTYFLDLKKFLLDEKTQHTIYPPGGLIFNAFDKTPFHQVKVVILGQDPYHGPGQAHGLCFSVPPGVPAPPSLVNIFKEIRDDLALPIPSHGNLEAWARQGVLLLNTSLTVRANHPLSHQNKGWETFTDSVIKTLSDRRSGLVFLLWGRNAKAKVPLIDTAKHFVLTAAHPSPLSAYNGFYGCRHFSKTNELLTKQSLEPIDWKL